MKQAKFKHLKIHKRLVKNLVAEKIKERGLTDCNDKLLRQLKIEVKHEIAMKIKAYEQQGDYHDYIVPGIYRSGFHKSEKTNGLYNMRYVLKSDTEIKSVVIISDTENVRPGIIKTSYLYRKQLIKNSTPAESYVKDFVKDLKTIEFRFQSAFYVCNSLYFADFYIPDCGTILEIDGSYHNTQSKIKEDEKRTAFLNSVGIKVIRMTNKDATDPQKLTPVLMDILQECKRRRDKEKEQRYIIKTQKAQKRKKRLAKLKEQRALKNKKAIA